ncbi:MAG: DNA-binding protein [Castellaniella sp.]
MTTKTEQLRALCSQHPQYEAGSAYTRTKILCDVLTKLGEPIPSWMVLREHIGKGSSGDINRGVKDYRSEHAELLQRMDGLPEGIPGKLAQPMQLLWQAALDEATAAFDQQRQDFEAQQAEAERIVADALQERDTMGSNLAVATEKVAGLQATVEQERERANTERAAREQAERMAEKHIADLTQQRDDMTKAVEANTAELRTLTARLEDERRRSLMQIEQARQQVELARQQAYRESEQKMAKLETQLRSEIADQTLEVFRWQKRCSDLESRNAKLSELVKKDARPAPVAAKRKPALKAAPGRVRRLKGKNYLPTR